MSLRSRRTVTYLGPAGLLSRNRMRWSVKQNLVVSRSAGEAILLVGAGNGLEAIHRGSLGRWNWTPGHARCGVAHKESLEDVPVIYDLFLV